MQLVAASRMRRAQEAADAARPYAREVLEMMHQLVAATGDDLLPPLLRARPVERSAYVVMTTNRGLCGALNSNVVRRAMEDIEPVRASAEVSVIVIGRRGRIALARFGAHARGLHRHLGPANLGRHRPDRPDGLSTAIWLATSTRFSSCTPSS